MRWSAADGSLHTAQGDIERPVFRARRQGAAGAAAGGQRCRRAPGPERRGAGAGLRVAHGGEAPHVRTAASMLAKAGVDAGVLECGAHWPYNDAATRALAARGETPSALHNNCSGKHAGFVCLGCRWPRRRELRGFLRGYVQPAAPGDARGDAALQAATGHDLARTAAGTDGCSIPDLRHSAAPPGAGLRARGHRHGLSPATRAPRSACAPRWRRRRSWWPAAGASTAA
jgi:hypothetical protein